MTYAEQLDKDRLFFTQCNDSFPLKCPECKSSKIDRHCRTHPNFLSLWWHLKQQHPEISESKLNEIAQVLNGLFKAHKWGMLHKQNYSEDEINHTTTTSSSILIDGKPPRSDRLKKLVKIANLLRIQSGLFPFFTIKNLKILIEKAIGPHDYRIMELYFECVTNHSTPDKINGVYDVTNFCDLLDV